MDYFTRDSILGSRRGEEEEDEGAPAKALFEMFSTWVSDAAKSRFTLAEVGLRAARFERRFVDFARAFGTWQDDIRKDGDSLSLKISIYMKTGVSLS